LVQSQSDNEECSDAWKHFCPLHRTAVVFCTLRPLSVSVSMTRFALPGQLQQCYTRDTDYDTNA